MRAFQTAASTTPEDMATPSENSPTQGLHTSTVDQEITKSNFDDDASTCCSLTAAVAEPPSKDLPRQDNLRARAPDFVLRRLDSQFSQYTLDEDRRSSMKSVMCCKCHSRTTTSFSDICGTCRKLGPRGVIRTCVGCGSIFQGFIDVCEDCIEAGTSIR